MLQTMPGQPITTLQHTAPHRTAQLWAGGFETLLDGLRALVAVGEMK